MECTSPHYEVSGSKSERTVGHWSCLARVLTSYSSK